MLIDQYKNINVNEAIDFNIAVCKYWIDTRNYNIDYRVCNMCVQLAKLHIFTSHDYCTTLLNVAGFMYVASHYKFNNQVLHLLLYPHYCKYKSTTIDALALLLDINHSVINKKIRKLYIYAIIKLLSNGLNKSYINTDHIIYKDFCIMFPKYIDQLNSAILIQRI